MRPRLLRQLTRVSAAVLVASVAHAESRADLSAVRAAPLRDRELADALRDAARTPRTLRIETEPPGAQIEVAYLRDGVQLARGVGTAPLVAQLPALSRVGERDRVRVRAELSGFAAAERSLPARGAASELRVELEQLAPSELHVSLLELGDVAELRIASDRALGVRLARTARGDRLVFDGLARSEAFAAQLEAVRGAGIANARVQQLAADLALEIDRSPAFARHELRLASYQAGARAPHVLVARWTPLDRGASTQRRAQAALAWLQWDDIAGCALEFERELRASVGADVLARALRDERRFARELGEFALQRVSELSPRNEIALVDGTRLAFPRPLEREAAFFRTAEAHGVLAAIRALAQALAPHGESPRALHAWLAPDASPAEFAAALEQASAAERSCAEPP